MLLDCQLLGARVILTPHSFGVISSMGGSRGDLFNTMERWCFRAEGDVLPGGDQGQDQHLQHPHEELSRKGKILLLLHTEQSVCQVNDYGLRAQT